MKLVTWNVNSIKMRLQRVLALLEREKPDILCLQELKCIEEMFPLEDIRKAGYHAYIHGQKTYNGVAIVSKHEAQDVRKGFDDPAARLISAKINGVTVISAYVPNGQAVGTEKYQYKLEWLGKLKEFLAKNFRNTEPLCIAGDFNVAPEDRDVHDPDLWRGKILFSEPEKKALADVCAWGLTDTFRLHHEEKGLYSWWDYRNLAFPMNLGLRIDFVLASSGLSKSCTQASILRDERKGEKPSDHAPVMALFSGSE